MIEPVKLKQICKIFFLKRNLKNLFLPPQIDLIKTPDKALKFSSKRLYYDVLKANNLTQKIVRNNLKSNYVPCFNLEEIYHQDKIFNKNYYLRKRFIKQVFKGMNLALYYENKFLDHIPEHILLKHFAEYVDLQVEFIKTKLDNQFLNFILSAPNSENVKLL